MSHRRQKDYWEKRTERFDTGTQARTRAAELRNREHVSHVKMNRESDDYVVTYSVARWYVEELAKASVRL